MVTKTKTEILLKQFYFIWADSWILIYLHFRRYTYNIMQSNMCYIMSCLNSTHSVFDGSSHHSSSDIPHSAKHKHNSPVCHRYTKLQDNKNIWISNDLTSTVHRNAAVWGRSISRYLQPLFWVLFIGQLWEVKKPLPGLFKVTSTCGSTGCFPF